MTAGEIVAYVGAAAWLPQIASWIYHRYVKADVTLLPADQIAVGYAMIGGGIELRIALAADRKDAIIDSISANIRHEDGEIHYLTWTRVSETFGEITDPTGARSVISHDTVVAFKVGVDAVVEKFITFGDRRLDDRVRPKILELAEHSAFLERQHHPDRPNVLVSSRQFRDVVETHQESFWWRAGRYEMTFQITSPKPLSYRATAYTFTLSRVEVDILRANVDLVERAFRNAVLGDAPGFQAEPINWNVRFVPVKKVDA